MIGDCFEIAFGSYTDWNHRITGHEVVAGDEEAYARDKRCRLGLIDHALSHGKSPLTMFSQCLISRSKIVCKLTGDTVNKNEEHIWKHQVERGAGTSGKTEKIQVTNKHRRVKEETDSDDSEFWMLKSSSGSESEQESDEENCKGSHCDAKEYEELSQRTKRMSIEIGPSSFASRKKKIRNDNESCFRRSLFFIAKESKNLQFAWDLSAQISNSPLLLSTAAASRRPLTVLDSEPNIRDMAVLLYQAQKLHYDSATMIMRLKATIQSLEGQMSSVTEKSAKYAWIAAEEVHKRKLEERSYAVASKLIDNSLYHFGVFSDNIVATSVVVNSTALNSKAPEKVFFHLVTNEIIYAEMKSWFTMNMDNLRGVTVEVQKFERFQTA
ncbi:hypothetical protein Bca101_027959 [Brassica carinata]